MKRGGNVLIYTSTWTFDTTIIDSIVEKDKRDGYERDMLNAFTRHAYFMYKRIRDCVNPRKCRAMPLPVVKEKLKQSKHMEFVTQMLHTTAEVVSYFISFAEKNLIYIK